MTTTIWELAGVQMNKFNKYQNGLQNLLRGYGALRSMLRNLMSLLKKCFPYITLSFFCHSVPHITSEPNGWGGTRHSHQNGGIHGYYVFDHLYTIYMAQVLFYVHRKRVSIGATYANIFTILCDSVQILISAQPFNIHSEDQNAALVIVYYGNSLVNKHTHPSFLIFT